MSDETKDEGLRSPARIKEWVLLAATVLGLLGNLGIHLVFSGSNPSTGAVQQLEVEMSSRVKADAELRISLEAARVDRYEMHERVAVMETRLKYLEDHRR